MNQTNNFLLCTQKRKVENRENKGGKRMSEKVATNIVATRPHEHRPTGMPTARAKKKIRELGGIRK